MGLSGTNPLPTIQTSTILDRKGHSELVNVSLKKRWWEDKKVHVIQLDNQFYPNQSELTESWASYQAPGVKFYKKKSAVFFTLSSAVLNS